MPSPSTPYDGAEALRSDFAAFPPTHNDVRHLGGCQVWVAVTERRREVARRHVVLVFHLRVGIRTPCRESRRKEFRLIILAYARDLSRHILADR